jgi:tyrosine-specific transport protein
MICKHTLGGALLVTGTSVGAGMLALPIVTGLGGFLPSIAIYIICYLIMTSTGLLYAELCLKSPKETNIISLANTYLGKIGKIFCWIVYLFLFYCLSIAYISGGGNFINSLFSSFPANISILIFVLFFGFFIYKGALIVDRINILLMIGLIISYICFVFFGAKHVNFSYLQNSNLNYALYSLPIIVISFGYQGIIPSLTTYLKKDAKRLRTAIFLGTTFTLIIYLLWEFLILGIIPLYGEHGLVAANALGQSAIAPLKYHTQIPNIYIIGQFFGFFALTTSFLGVNLGLFDFLSDGLKIAKKGFFKKFTLCVVTFLPPLIITLTYPHIFLIALDYAGGIGGVLLLILLPALMVWNSRYIKKENNKKQLLGGKIALAIIFIFILFEFAIKIFKDINH